MNKECIDPKIGLFLHAYELETLGASDTDIFETHLLTCDFCFEEVQSFKAQAKILRADPEIKDSVEKEISLTKGKSKIRQYLWPDFPLIFRPAAIFILVIILLYPAYLGLRLNNADIVRPVEIIALTATRSAESILFSLSSGKDLVLTFSREDISNPAPVVVTIADFNGIEKYKNGSFSDFDSRGIGQLLIPRELLSEGIYRITIDIPETSLPAESIKYYIKIVP
jgi:hypothetical protein